MYTFITVNDKQDFCECCDKRDLKKVAWLLDESTGEQKHFGVICASKLLNDNSKKALKKASSFDVNKWVKIETIALLNHDFAEDIHEVLTDCEHITKFSENGEINSVSIKTEFGLFSLPNFLKTYTDTHGLEINFPHRLDIDLFINEFGK